MSAPLVGVAEHYAAFVKLCRVRIEQLGITYETVDAICGFPARYTATLLCEKKTMSVYSFFTLARALAMLPGFHHDDDQHKLLRAREDWIGKRVVRYPLRPGGAVRFALHRDFYRQIGRKGALRANALRMRRKEAARIAARARWGRQ